MLSERNEGLPSSFRLRASGQRGMTQGWSAAAPARVQSLSVPEAGMVREPQAIDLKTQPHDSVLHRLPAALHDINDRLARVFAAAGHELYLVGGVVRDLLLGRPVTDLDYTTSAPRRRRSDWGRKPGQTASILSAKRSALLAWSSPESRSRSRRTAPSGTQRRTGAQPSALATVSARTWHDAISPSMRSPSTR